MRGEQVDLSALPAEILWLDTAPSTNDYLRQLRPQKTPRVALTWEQTEGRGRLGRTWISRPGESLALSLDLGGLVPGVMDDSWRGALPLLIASELASAIDSIIGVSSEVKWPNDVLIGGKKVAGILGEIPEPGRVIVGVGLNVWAAPEGDGVSSSTSLSAHGLNDTTVFASFLRGFLQSVIQRIRVVADGVSDSDWLFVRSLLGTLSKEVVVFLPDGSEVRGIAKNLDSSGRLLVKSDSGDQVISAGDVTHLRTP